ASKFTEVGYIGRDVESMVRDLVESAIDMVRNEREVEVEGLAQERVHDRLLDLLLPVPPEVRSPATATASPSGETADAPNGSVFVVSASGDVSSTPEAGAGQERYTRTREKLKQLLLDG